MATEQEYLAAIQRERDANTRAQAEGYESAAHKESYANVGAQAAGFSDAAAYERDADIRAQAAGFDSAVAQEMDANRRSIDAGFTSAVDQEIDANRRAREAGYLNAADYESGLRTRSDAPFLDPRLQPAPVIPEQFRLGTANLLKYNPDQPNVPGYDPNWRNDPKYAGGFDVHGNPITGGGILGGPPNPTVPSFGYQNWSRFMPTNFGLAEGGGVHYQPWLTGGAGMGGGRGGFAGPDTWATGGGGTTLTGGGGTTATGGPGPINPNIWGGTGTTTGGNVTTDAQGNQWVMSNGQWIPATSELGSILAAGDTPRHPLGMYDSGGNWVGAEGGGEVEAMNLDKFDADQTPAGAAFMDNLGKVVGAVTNPYGFVSAFNNAYSNTQPTSTWSNPNDTTTQPSSSILGTQPAFTPARSLIANEKNWRTGLNHLSPYNAYSQLGYLGIPASPGHAMDVTRQVDSFANMRNAAWETAARETEAMGDVALDADFDANMGFYE